MNLLHKTLKVLILVFGAIAIGIIGFRVYKEFSAPTSYTPSVTNYGVVAPFSFTNQYGNPLSKEDLKGKLWVADFIFTRCQGPCPLMTHRMSSLVNDFNSPDLKFVSFSVDPDFDTPPVLKAYADNYGAKEGQWHFLTGPKKDIYDLIRTSFKLAVGNEQGEEISDTDILHSLYFILVDKEGIIRGYYNSTQETDLNLLRSELKNRLSP